MSKTHAQEVVQVSAAHGRVRERPDILRRIREDRDEDLGMSEPVVHGVRTSDGNGSALSVMVPRMS